ncbi:MAG: PilZ domain-containing protein [Sulfuricaulis sp.]
MINERRDSQRIPVVLDAVLNYQAQVMVCTVRDISLNGAFIEGMPDGLPYFNAPVELGLTLTNAGETKQYRLPAKIRRLTDKGAGLSFGDVGMDAYFSLVSLVYNA